MYDKINICDIEEISDIILNRVCDENEKVYVILKYDEASALVHDILKRNEVSPRNIDFLSDENSGYYINYLFMIDENLCISCRRIKKPLYSGIVYISDECDLSLVDTCDEENVTIFSVM